MNSDHISNDGRRIIRCPQCESLSRTEDIDEIVPYQDGEQTIELHVLVPVHICVECGFEFTDEVGEGLRHAAVCKYKGVLSPSDIREIRGSMSRTEFGRITGLGAATLARWESGSIIQNTANDRFLRLLRIARNMDFLRSIDVRPQQESTAKFRLLVATDELTKQAIGFSPRKAA